MKQQFTLVHVGINTESPDEASNTSVLVADGYSGYKVVSEVTRAGC